MPHVIKISAKINAMQNIKILLFVRSLSFTSLRLCMKMQTVCKSLFTKGAQMFTICKDTCLETLSALVNCGVNDVLSEIGPYRN